MNKILKTSIVSLLSGLLTASTALAQGPGGGGQGGGPPQGGGRPPLSPVMEVLDTDEDGELSQDEIEAASMTLAGLDTDGDGALSSDELKPEMKEDADEENPRPMPPAPPEITALDTDQDGIISADELSVASDSLLTLDTDEDLALSKKELRPRRR
ncbi:MAG: hypothetical protein ACSHX0_02315 [Akkermansiaceae bacterium]